MGQNISLRKFNRAITNRVTMLIAGHFIFSLIRHRGRKSGKNYATPLVVSIKDNYAYIPLPYGADTDWFLNVSSAEKCELVSNRKRYQAIKPTIINQEQAIPMFSNGLQKAFRKAHIAIFVKMQISLI
jgi:deazaflavin-dependent oxidoreductase (nitroreductase family)